MPLKFLQRRIRLLFHPAGQSGAAGGIELEVSTADLAGRIIAALFDAPAPRRADLESLGDLLGWVAFVIQLKHAIFKRWSVSHSERV